MAERGEWTYAKAGINREAVNRAHRAIRGLAASTFKVRAGRLGRVLVEVGHYAGLVELDGDKALAVHTDGCGSKVLIAQSLKKFSTIGVDCVAMCVNDLICVGAEPLAFVDYLALEKADEKLIAEIVKGLVRGTREAGVVLVGGETAILPSIIRGALKGCGFDVSGTAIGIVKKSSILLGDKIREGDLIFGLESNGIHSNGLTLARRVLLKANPAMRLKSRPKILRGATIGEELLKPTRIYVRSVLDILRQSEVHALAHITGGAFTKLSRFWRHTRRGFRFSTLPKPPPIFRLIKDEGKISSSEMYKTFNMGIGFCVIAPPWCESSVRAATRKWGIKAHVVGEVVKERVIKVFDPETGEEAVNLK